MTAVIPIVVALLTTMPLGTQIPKVSSAQPGSSLVVIGIFKNALGEAVVGETVYFSGLTDGKASLVWTVKDGVAMVSGIKNPRAKTDERGGFRIEVRFEELPTGEVFALGTEDMGRGAWFRSDDGKPLIFKIPPKPAKGGTRQVDVGTVIR